MHARSVVFEMSPDKIDDAVSQFEDGVIPRFREISGYKGFTLLVNRESGKAFGVSFLGERGRRQRERRPWHGGTTGTGRYRRRLGPQS